MRSFREVYSKLAATKLGAHLGLLGFNDYMKILVVGIAWLEGMVKGPTVVILKDQAEVERAFGLLKLIIPSEMRDLLTMLPYMDCWGRERTASQTIVQINRLLTLAKLQTESRPLLILTTVTGLSQRTMSKAAWQRVLLSLSINEDHDFEGLIAELRRRGYRECSSVVANFDFAIRGGILDLFCPLYSKPIRIEFVGDTIVSLRHFDLISQGSVEELTTIWVLPRYEMEPWEHAKSAMTQKFHEFFLATTIDRKDQEGIIDAIAEGYFFTGIERFLPLFWESTVSAVELIRPGWLWSLSDLKVSLDIDEKRKSKLRKKYLRDASEGKLIVEPAEFFLQLSEADFLGGAWSLAEFSGIGDHDEIIGYSGTYLTDIPVLKNILKITERFDAWVKYWHELLSHNYSIFLVANSQTTLDKLHHLLQARGIQFHTFEGFADLVLGRKNYPRGILLGIGGMTGALLLPDESILLLSTEEIFGRDHQPSDGSVKNLKNLIRDYSDLKPGDLVVHILHGICEYRGIETMPVDGFQAEFLLLRFGGDDKLYLPVDRLNVLQKYVSGGSDARPKLDRLQSKAWQGRKKKAQKSIIDIAEKLIEAKAKRKAAAGVAFSEPGELYYEFEGTFPYDETDDQLSAIADVNADLSSPTPMDRLICGDVGFGKTEIALRAAMRVLVDGYQVLVVVPTTVLCYQHARVFGSRFNDFGISIGMVNRFVKPKVLKDRIAQFSSGRLDILIGTHRALSKDVLPKQLGLLIVDEEQRFGVAQKEMIKSLADGCEILTLTATPIPRTLHMAMLGLKDISVIATPPKLRKPVKTFVSSYDPSLVREAILEETSRGGQVFFIHNRVLDIEEVAREIRELTPEVSCAVAHGQLPADKLERVMVAFMTGEFDILVCTTIVESGVDIPNVNTLIVNHANRFGLAQLYQIRGRVGRSERQSYCYLMLADEGTLTDDASKRLDALLTYQELGAGFQVASRDLEARGAGDLLGSQQSGFIETIGFELYSEMLERALQGLPNDDEGFVDTELKIPIEARIPGDYIIAEQDRIRTYRRLFAIESDSELSLYKAMIIDRFGNMPDSCQRLFAVAQLKGYARKCRISCIKVGSTGHIEFIFQELHGPSSTRIRNLMADSSDKYQFLSENRVLVNLLYGQERAPQAQDVVLKHLVQYLGELCDN